MAILAKSKKTLLEIEECEKKMEMYTPEERKLIQQLIDLVKQVIKSLSSYCEELEQTIYIA
jgi:DNA-directed RNA polymerase specialized sigma subunit